MSRDDSCHLRRFGSALSMAGVELSLDRFRTARAQPESPTRFNTVKSEPSQGLQGFSWMAAGC